MPFAQLRSPPSAQSAAHGRASACARRAQSACMWLGRARGRRARAGARLRCRLAAAVRARLVPQRERGHDGQVVAARCGAAGSERALCGLRLRAAVGRREEHRAAVRHGRGRRQHRAHAPARRGAASRLRASLVRARRSLLGGRGRAGLSQPEAAPSALALLQGAPAGPCNRARHGPGPHDLPCAGAGRAAGGRAAALRRTAAPCPGARRRAGAPGGAPAASAPRPRPARPVRAARRPPTRPPPPPAASAGGRARPPGARSARLP